MRRIDLIQPFRSSPGNSCLPGAVGAKGGPPVLLRIPAEMKRKKYWKETLEAYLYLLPAFAILGMFSFYPVVKSIIISFYDWHLLRKEQYFVGLENYQRLLNDKNFLMAISNTFRTWWALFPYPSVSPDHCCTVEQ